MAISAERHAPRRATAEFRIGADAGAIRRGLGHALGVAPLAMLGADDRERAEIVLAEALNNVAEHAYRGNSGEIRLFVTRRPRDLLCRVEDAGAPMPGRCLPGIASPVPGALMDSGYGWHLIRALTNGVLYERVDDINRLTFRLPLVRAMGRPAGD